MASSGYLVSVGSKSSEGKTKEKRDLEEIISKGVYATWLTESKDGKWSSAMYGTLADYATIKPGDNIYFFADRKIYGIGEVVDCFGEKQAAFALDNPLNDSYSKRPYSENSTHRKIVKDDVVKVQRWGVVFKPAPFFFSEGVDMDDLLNSDPLAFRSLRVFWKRSFIQFDEKENAAFKSALLRLNEAVLDSDSADGRLPACLKIVNPKSGEWKSTPLSLKRLLSEDPNPCETLVEAGLISALIREEKAQWNVLANGIS